MKLRISRALQMQMLAEAAASPDVEVCGLLFGAGDAVSAIQPCTNVAPNPARQFEIDPAALIAAHKAERAGGPRLIGCYHSHPNDVLTLSPDDLASATEGQIWLLIAGNALAAWQCLGGDFQKISIEPVTMLLATA
jgi:desampylase